MLLWMAETIRRYRQTLQYRVVTAIIWSTTLCLLCQAQTPALDVVGVENPTDYTDKNDTGTNNAYMLTAPNLHISGCGLIDKFRFYSMGDGPLHALVWRPDAGGLYKLIHETIIPANEISPGQYIVWSISDSATVENGDLLGWWTPAPSEPVVTYSDVTSNATADGVQKQVLASIPAVGGTTSWTAVPDITKRYAFGAYTKPSDPPYLTNCPTAPVDVPISTGVGDQVLTLSASDPNADDVTLGIGIEIDGTSTYFDVNNDTGVVTVTTALAAGTETVNFISTDYCGTQSTPCTITFNIVDDRPNITSLPVAAVELNETTPGRVVLHTLTFKDDGPTTNVDCDYTIDKNGPFLFERSADDAYEVIYQQSDADPLNADDHSVYQFWFWCNDGISDSINRTFQVTVLKNEPPDLVLPTEITNSTKDLIEGAEVHDLSQYAIDPENDELTFSMNCTSPPTCPLKMDPVTGKVFTTEDLRTHKISPYAFSVTVCDERRCHTDMTSLVLTDINTIPVLDKPPPPDPVKVLLKENAEHINPGERYDVYTVIALDPDTDETVDFLFEWEDAAMAEYFDITVDTTAKTAEIKTKQDLDFEKLSKQFQDFFKLNITAIDSRGEKSQMGQLHVVVEDVPEPPTFKSKNYHLDADEDTAGTALACPLFDVEDKDFYEYFKFSANCGNGIFQIDQSYSGGCQGLFRHISEHQLDPPSGPNKAFEKTTCDVIVEDKDGLTDTATVEITTNEINDNPPELQETQYDYTATNETRPGTVMGNIGTTTDLDVQDKHKEVTYTLNTNDFLIDENGQITNVVDMYGISLPKVYRFMVTATDNAGHTDTAPVTVQVLPIYPTTTTTTTTAAYPDVYDAITDYFGDTGNLIWTILACLLGALFLGLLAYTCARCLSTPGACAAFRGGRCFGRGRPSCFGGRKRVGANARPSRHTGPARTQKAPPRGNDQPKRRSRLFDCFDKKDKGEPGNARNPGARDPANPDQGRPWQPWKDDFGTAQWVG